MLLVALRALLAPSKNPKTLSTPYFRRGYLLSYAKNSNRYRSLVGDAPGIKILKTDSGTRNAGHRVIIRRVSIPQECTGLTPKHPQANRSGYRSRDPVKWLEITHIYSALSQLSGQPPDQNTPSLTQQNDDFYLFSILLLREISGLFFQWPESHLFS